MLKITIKAADEATFHRTLLAFVELSLERFDTDTLLDEARHRLGKKGYAVDVVPNGHKQQQQQQQSEPPVNEIEKAQPQLAKRRPGRPPKNQTFVSEVQPAQPVPTKDEVIKALEKYALQNSDGNEDGMLKARGIMAKVSGIGNAALKDVNPADYRKLIEALA